MAQSRHSVDLTLTRRSWRNCEPSVSEQRFLPGQVLNPGLFPFKYISEQSVCMWNKPRRGIYMAAVQVSHITNTTDSTQFSLTWKESRLVMPKLQSPFSHSTKSWEISVSKELLQYACCRCIRWLPMDCGTSQFLCSTIEYGKEKIIFSFKPVFLMLSKHQLLCLLTLPSW